MLVLYFMLNALFVGYLLWDGRRRKTSGLWAWAVATAIGGVLLLPFYLASRPLRRGETRTGGFGWNVVRYFVMLWTVALAGVAGIMIGSGPGTGAAAMGLVVLGIIWLPPTLLAGLVGYFLKKDVQEEGPTGALAEQREPVASGG